MANTGKYNSGDRNSGNWNSGYSNSGNRNSGSWNSGYWNLGDYNSGYSNSGNWNSGDLNSGNWNLGYGNSTDRETGIFNSTPGTLRMFNKPTDKKWGDIVHPNFNEFILTRWIRYSDMTDEEKSEHPESETTDGYLKEYTYKEAWANYWRDTDEEDRQRVLNLPNFDAEVFKDITGIDVTKTETINIGGKKYKVTDELRKALEGLKEAE